MIWLTFLPVALYDICGWASPAVEAVATQSSCVNIFFALSAAKAWAMSRKVSEALFCNICHLLCLMQVLAFLLIGVENM